MSGNGTGKLSIDRIKLSLDNQLILDDISFDLMDGHVCICVNIEVSMNSRKF